MLKIVLISLTIMFGMSHCVYDPPEVGKSVIFENQTDRFIYIYSRNYDSSREYRMYDTFLMNNDMYISKRDNFIPAYSNWVFFLPDNITDNKQKDNLIFYIIPQNLLRNTTPDNLKNYASVRHVAIKLNELSKDSALYVFCFDDSISVTYKHNLNTFY